MLGDLQLIFGTVSIGLITLLFILILPWFLSSKYVDTQLQEFFGQLLGPDVFTTQVAALAVPFVFGLGIITQDLTDHLTDGEFESHYSFINYQHKVLGSEGNHRFNTLFPDSEPKGLWTSLRGERKNIEPILQSIYEDESNEIDRFFNDAAAFIEKDEEQARDFVNSIYYEAKNWSYSQDNYFIELEQIQRRVDFSRSLFLISSWAFVLTFGLMLLRILCLFLLGQSKKKLKVLGIRASSIMLLTLTVGFLGWLGYSRSEINFNERAFGYFISHYRLAN